MPRTLYNDNQKNLKDYGFWKNNINREQITPVLYVEEIHED